MRALAGEGAPTGAPEADPAQPAATYEDVVHNVLEVVDEAGGVPKWSGQIPWDAFLRLSDLVHEHFSILSTTFTPMMRRLLFGLGYAAQPSTVVGVGTYVGYTFSWLVRDRGDPDAGPFAQRATAIDVDLGANVVARRNCARLGHGDRLCFLDADGTAAVSRMHAPIDLLYLDIDDPVARKAGYVSVLAAALPLLAPGALVVAHDICVPAFADDFERYHDYVRRSTRFRRYWILPIDACGVSVGLVDGG